MIIKQLKKMGSLTVEEVNRYAGKDPSINTGGEGVGGLTARSSTKTALHQKVKGYSCRSEGKRATCIAEGGRCCISYVLNGERCVSPEYCLNECECCCDVVKHLRENCL